MRIKNWLQRHKKHKKFIKQAKWYRLWRWNVYKQVRLALVKAWEHAYIDRKLKKRDQRSLWIERLSAVLWQQGLKYSRFIHTMALQEVTLNRKVLSNIALVFPNVFEWIVKEIQSKK